MTPKRWQQVKELFQSALELAPDERDAFLDEACSNNPSLKAEVESLIAHHEEAGSFLVSPAVDIEAIVKQDDSPVSSDGFIGRTLGDFIVREKLGEGGFGAVYRAEQLKLGREAVIKILRTKHSSNEQIIKRFKREAQLASRLEHPYTAHIYAFEVEADGLLWIAMEYVRGTPLDKLLETQGPLPLERFVPLLDKICEVVHTAHEHGIIHRDLKPANVMVIARAGRLLPKLLDFGIAKGLGGESAIKESILKACDKASTSEDETVEMDSAGDECRSEATAATAAMPEGGMLQIAGPSKSSNPSFQIETYGAIGSPSYMSPEQWENTATADSRTDIYALGVLSYEALTGRLPFQGSGYALFQAHKTQSAPSLGSSLPAALDKVIAKATAKKAEDRYSTAIEYAAAFREAAGLSEQRASLPQMEEELRDSLLANAPQPIAQAIANLGAARNAHQAREEIIEIFRAAVRYVGISALACRARIGAGGKTDGDQVIDALRKLHRHRLSEEEWLELARELCRPFAHKRDAYPMPELVSLFFEQGSDKPSRESMLYKPLLDMQESIAGGASQTEEQVRESVAIRLVDLERLLRGLSFLNDYKLTVPHQDHLEIWMGLGRGRRDFAMAGEKRLEEGKPVLIDSSGLAAVSLWPMLQSAESSPGAQQELFFLEGKGRQGAKLTAIPSGFEKQDEELWEWFRENFFDLGEGSQAQAEQERAPYLGLAAFKPEDANIFFGRERETEAFLNRLKAQPLLAVVGASGAGKSSFVQAGVIPGLAEGWRAITVRPGSSPIAALSARLAKERIEVGDLRESLEQNTNALGVALRVAAAASSSNLVLIVDQFEELFTLCLNEEERRLYAEGLAKAARSAEDPVRVILTLRDDFLMKAEQMKALRDRLSQGWQLLVTPDSEDLIRIIAEPARRAGYEFDDKNLPREIAQALSGRPGALPLLAFTAAKLWENRDRQFKLLRRKTYESMGGVGGALAQHAESIIAEMTQEELLTVRDAFRHLVTAEGTRAVLTRPELIQVLGNGNQAEFVLEKLIGARLLTASEGEGGIDRIEIAHEALLEAWPRLVNWRQEDAEGARLRDQLRAAARQWEERGRTKGLLWRDEALKEYELWRSRYPSGLTDIEEAFGAASLAAAARIRRIKRAAAIIAFSIAMIGSIALYAINEQTKNRLLNSYEDQGRQELLNGNAMQSLVYLSEAYRQGRNSPSLRFMLAQAMAPVDAQLFTIEGHKAAVYFAAYSPDGKRIVTASADKTAKVWDADSGKLLVSLEGDTREVKTAAFSPDGKRIVTASEDSTAKVWDAESGKLLFPLVRHKGWVGTALFSPDGTRIVTAGSDSIAKVWDAESGMLLLSLVGHRNELRSAAFSPDGKRIVTSSTDKTAMVWDTESGKPLFSLEGHSERLYAALFSPDGTRIVTASSDSTAKVWDAESGKLLFSLVGHRSTVLTAFFSPDGKQIVTASMDKSAKVWDVESGKLLASLEGHADEVLSAAFSPDGTRIVTASPDKTAKVWDVARTKRLIALEGHRDEVNSAFFSPDGKRILTSSRDSTAKVWDVESGKLLLSLEGHKGWWVGTARFSPDGTRVVTASPDKTAKVWDVESGRLLASLGHAEEVYSAVFSPDSKRIVTICGDRTAKVWDAESGKQILSLEGHTGLPFVAVFSPDGKRIVTTSNDKTAKVWDAESGKQILSLEGHTANLGLAAFSPDGKRIATASADATAKVWDAKSGNLLFTLVGHPRMIGIVAYSPDGKRIVTAGAHRAATVWDAESGKQLLSLEGHKNSVNYVSFSPDGTRIVLSSGGRTTKVWDFESGKLLASVESHTDKLNTASFSPDGARIVTASVDKTANIWDVRLETRSPSEIADIVKRKVPYRIDQGQLVLK